VIYCECKKNNKKNKIKKKKTNGLFINNKDKETKQILTEIFKQNDNRSDKFLVYSSRLEFSTK
jgi:hypothetical protein